MPSLEHAALTQEIEQLRQSLADVIHPLGEYDETQKRRTLAFVVLAHACIEQYLESRCREIIKTAREAAKAGTSHPAIAGLLAFSGRGDLLPPVPPPEKNIEGWTKRHKIQTRITAAIESYEKVVSNNHGIKEFNVISLVLPLGIPYEALDQTLLGELNSFGEDRGYAAHVTDKAFRDAIDTGTEVKRISQLVTLLVKLDVELEKLLPTPASSPAPTP